MDFAVKVPETQTAKILAVTATVKSFFSQGFKNSFASKKKSGAFLFFHLL